MAAEDEALAARWRMLSAFPADFDEAAAAAVWETGSADDATDALNGHEGRGLVEAIGEDRYRLHGLLRVTTVTVPDGKMRRTAQFGLTVSNAAIALAPARRHSNWNRRRAPS